MKTTQTQRTDAAAHPRGAGHEVLPDEDNASPATVSRSVIRRLKRIAELATTAPGLSGATRAMILRRVKAALNSAGNHRDANRGHSAEARREPVNESSTERPPDTPLSHHDRLDRLGRSLDGIRKAFAEIQRLADTACRRTDEQGDR